MPTSWLATVTVVDFRRGHDPDLARLSGSVHRRLAELDRLREVLAERRGYRFGTLAEDAQRAVFRRHVNELRALAGQSQATAKRQEAEVEALVAMAAEYRSGQPITAEYLGELARRLPDFDPPMALPDDMAGVLAAAAVEAHPVVRAAHLLLTCADALHRAGAPTAGPPPFLRPLPWALASLSLMRSCYPPPALDRRLDVSAHATALGEPKDRLTASVLLLADLVTVSLRADLSRPAHGSGAPPPRSAPLAASLHRRILGYLRERRGPLSLVLRELDPDARAEVGTGSSDDSPSRDRCETAAARALFTAGPGCWWSSVDLDFSGGALRLLILVQDVGSPPTGVLAVTADAWLTTAEGAADVLDLACTDSVTLAPTDSVGERWPRVEAFVDDIVARAVGHLTRALH